MKERLSRERRGRLAKDLWAATYVLLGLRYSNAFANLLFQEVLGMEESTTYQAIARKERLAEARRLLLLMGQDKLGPPSKMTQAAVNAVEDVDRVEQLCQRLHRADSWEALLSSPPRRRRSSRRQSNG